MISESFVSASSGPRVIAGVFRALESRDWGVGELLGGGVEGLRMGGGGNGD